MGTTAGDYGFVLERRFFGAPQESDAFPTMAAHLVAEAAEMTTQDWDDVAARVPGIAWVASADSDMVAASGGRLAVPGHPSGDGVSPEDNFSRLVPSASRGETEAYLQMLRECNPKMAGHPALVALNAAAIIQTTPSFRALAAMPAATKAQRPFALEPATVVVAADLDNDQLTVWRAVAGKDNPPPFGEPYATASLGDPDSLQGLATELFAAMSSPEPPVLDKRYTAVPRLAGTAVLDGMWRRPEGWPPLDDDPGGRSGQINPSPPPPDTAGNGRGKPRCLKPTTSAGAKGPLCTHPKPPVLGMECAGGHRRTR